jgi:hypothetical protein
VKLATANTPEPPIRRLAVLSAPVIAGVQIRPFCRASDAANDIAAEGEYVDPADLATVSSCITHTVRRFGNWTLNLTPPDRAPATRLDLELRVLFAPTPAGN